MSKPPPSPKHYQNAAGTIVHYELDEATGGCWMAEQSVVGCHSHTARVVPAEVETAAEVKARRKQARRDAVAAKRSK